MRSAAAAQTQPASKRVTAEQSRARDAGDRKDDDEIRGPFGPSSSEPR